MVVSIKRNDFPGCKTIAKRGAKIGMQEYSSSSQCSSTVDVLTFYVCVKYKNPVHVVINRSSTLSPEK